MPNIQLTFTNNSDLRVLLRSITPPSTQLLREAEVDPYTSLSIVRDTPMGTQWRINSVTPGFPNFHDFYVTTSDAVQFHLIRDSGKFLLRFSINFITLCSLRFGGTTRKGKKVS